MRYTDPSGHACVEGTSYCVNSSTGQTSGNLTSYNNSPTFLSDRLDGKRRVEAFNCWSPIPLQYIPPATQESGYCGGGPNMVNSGLDCIANFAQDGALIVDIPFALIEIGLLGTLCWGGFESCSGALFVSHKIFIVPNVVESGLGWISSGASIGTDLTDDDNWFGDDSGIALTTLVAGGISNDPVVDFIIDGYGSMYNHGHVQSIYSIFDQ